VSPGFLAIGHVVRDLQPQGWRLGGTVTYAALQAHRLGIAAAVVTRHANDVDLSHALPDVEVLALPSDVTTTFQNTYDGSNREQLVLQQAEELSADDIPSGWRATPVVLFGPVCGEVHLSQTPSASGSLIGVSAQGWLREVGPDRHVRRSPWSGDPFWRGAGALFVSEEDLGERPDQVERWISEVPVVAVTRAGRGARVHAGGAWATIDGIPAREVDPTGAGDVFAAAFLVRYHESKRVAEAARFASAAAACAIEGVGTEGIASRAVIEQRLAMHPEVVLE
jgi:hypothetical protein